MYGKTFDEQPKDNAMRPDSALVQKVITDLLRIVRVAMPPHLQRQDIR